MAAHGLLDIHITRTDGRATVRLAGELDVMSSAELADRLSELAPTPRTVLDLSEVTFMDSTGLRALWLLHQQCAGHGGHLVLRSPSQAVLRLLSLTGLASVFDVAG